MRQVTGITRSAVRSVAAIVGLLAIVTGCGTARHPSDGRAGTRLTAAHRSADSNSRLIARELARKALADLRLPSGTRKVPWRAGRLNSSRPMLPSITGDVIDRRALYEVNEPMGRVDRFLATHVPAGMVAGDAAVATRDFGRVRTRYNVDYNLAALPSRIYEATLATTITPQRSGSSLLRVDAQVAWYPRRSIAEHVVPSRYRSVTVTAPVGTGSSIRMQSRTFTSRSVISRLAAIVNALPAEPNAPAPCGALTTSTTMRLAFAPASSSWPMLALSSYGCATDTVTARGLAQPELSDSRLRLLDALRRLMAVATTS